MSEVGEAGPTTLLAVARQRVDLVLDQCAQRVQLEMSGRLGEAMAYALLSPGKRIRPALTLAAYQAAGGSHPAIDGVAAAIEIVHTYSLVHDDLPCMDDDDLRRGRLTTHRAYDVATATRVGYLLVPFAAEVLSEAGTALGLAATTVGRMAIELFEAGGINGMVGGQWRDLEAEGAVLDLDRLRAVHMGKTGALIRAAVILGGVAAGAPESTLTALREFGEEIGLAFQVADDVLDATATTESLGKMVRRDVVLAKSTYVSLLGVDGARVEAERHRALAVSGLQHAGIASGELEDLARYIVNRATPAEM